MNEDFIRTSDQIGDFPPTYRKVTAEDRMRRILNENEKKPKSKEPLNWKLLLGLKQPL